MSRFAALLLLVAFGARHCECGQRLPISRQDIRLDQDLQNASDGPLSPLTATPVRRLVYYDSHAHAGLDDRIYVMLNMLSFAHVLRAHLAFPPPTQLLGRIHGDGDSLAEWWDDYYVTEPPVHKFEDVRCMPGVPEVIVTHPDVVDALDAKTYNAIKDRKAPLCLRIQSSFYDFTRGGKTEMLMIMGFSDVMIRASDKVERIMDEVAKEYPALKDTYNVAHLRMGDKTVGHNCVTAPHVMDAIKNLTTAHPEEAGGREAPWLIMSDGSDAFFSSIQHRAEETGLTYIAESDVKTLRELKDNYLRYTVLSCFCEDAAIQLWIYKRIGGRCNLRGRTNRVSARFTCRENSEAGEAFVRDEWGPQWSKDSEVA